MTRVWDFFRGPEISFSPCNTTKKSRPSLKILHKGKLRLLNKNPLENLVMLTGGSLVTDGRVTQIFRKEKMRSNYSNDGNYLLLRGILSKLNE
jgi:hypothetical protein